ncbi:ATP-binding protein [Bradyrhizobium sp. dw_411]|uniref:AAA family ATPase n=1 Tax=Bradyrhizobium sp. dw_411 TaxID=2720082 RepID=UPI001BCACE77|nr:ATP-binding protein [Bradyrhizobium sp. dw_411]
MTNSKQIIAMIRSHAAGDSQQFLSIAEHIAADADKAGKSKVADEIKNLVQRVRNQAPGAHKVQPIPMAALRGELSGLVGTSYPEFHVSDLVVNSDLREKILRIVREHRERETLESEGMRPRRKFLFSGPPGTGKGMTAAAIACELGLPLFKIRLDGVITKFLGETAAKLRLIFDAMQSARGVYFFDEVDALASSRGSDNDIGEARRMLNSFLQFLEEDESFSVIVAATNHRSLLDTALFRRFDSAFVYSNPSPAEARQVLRNNLLRFDREAIAWEDVDAHASGLSQADLAAAAEDAARIAVLDNRSVLSTEVLCRALDDRANIHRE